MRKKVLFLGIVTALVAGSFSIDAMAATKAGSPCKKLKLISISNGKIYTCIKSGKKLVWDKGALITTAQLPSSTSESPSPSPSASQIVIADPEITDKSVYANSSVCQLKSDLGRQANLGYQIHPSYLNSVGTLNLAIIFTTYTDAAGDDRAFEEYIQRQLPEVARFYEKSSYGKLKVTMTTTSKYYKINKPSTSYNLMAMDHTSKFWEVIEDAVAAAKGDYDLSKVDGFLVVMPSTSATVDLGATGLDIRESGKNFQQGITASYINPSTKVPVKPKFMVHELGHNLGLLHPLNQQNGYVWDVMFWEEVPAADLFGWEKYILKWIEPTQVDCLSTIPSTPVINYLEATGISSSKTKLNVIRISDSKALVIESRRKSDIDDLLPNDEGVLVYSVDANLGSNKAPIKLFANNSRSRTFGNRWLLVGTIQKGESIVAEGVKISVLKSAKTGDFISISKN